MRCRFGQAAKHGVIVKSGEALERMGAVTVARFDKTGTLQDGTALRVGAVRTIAEPRASGVRSLMLTGDHELIARKFAAEAGVHDVRFELKPDGKSRIVEEEQAKGASVVMVGDGVNDAPGGVMSRPGGVMSRPGGVMSRPGGRAAEQVSG